MITALFKRFLNQCSGVALIEFAMVFPVMFLLLFGGIEISRLILIQQKLEKAGYVMADIVTQYKPATKTPVTGEISVQALNDEVFPQLARMMGTYSAPNDQAAIITSVRVKGAQAGRTLTIDWQIAQAGPGLEAGTCDGLSQPTCAKSVVNGLAPNAISNSVRGALAFTTTEGDFAKGKILALPEQVANEDYTIMVNEVFYFYRPLLGSLVEDVGAAGGSGFAGYKFYLKPKIYVKRTYFMPRLEGKLFDLPDTATPANGFPVP